jgi:hypothetical protein
MGEIAIRQRHLEMSNQHTRRQILRSNPDRIRLQDFPLHMARPKKGPTTFGIPAPLSDAAPAIQASTLCSVDTYPLSVGHCGPSANDGI